MKRATLGVWVGVIDAMMAPDIADNDEHYLPMIDDANHLTRRDCPDQTGYNNFEVQEGRSAGIYVLFLRSEPICLFICSMLQTCMR